ncbi:hypothetical protein BH09SUM1_BH09SUM1_20630 [soil metagenome]
MHKGFRRQAGVISQRGDKPVKQGLGYRVWGMVKKMRLVALVITKLLRDFRFSIPYTLSPIPP